MTHKNTTDSILSAILAATSSDNLVTAISKATQGTAISKAMLKTLDEKLTAKIPANDKGQTTRKDQIMMVLGVTEHLPAIMQAAKELFADKSVVRRGNVHTATMVSIRAVAKGAGDNAWREEMATKCHPVDASAKALGELQSLLQRAMVKAKDCGKADMFPALEKLISAAS